MVLHIGSVLPNTPTAFKGDLQGTDEYPYITMSNSSVGDSSTVIVPKGRSVRELGETIKAHCGTVSVPDKYGLEGIIHIDHRFLTLRYQSSTSVGRMEYVCIYNLEPRYSISLCYYLTGNLSCPSVSFVKAVLAVEPDTIMTSNRSRLREVIEACITSDKAVC